MIVANITTAEANALIGASVAGVTYTEPTTPITLALVTSGGDVDNAGTEVTGGSYARQTITFSTAASGAVSNAAAVNFTGMPTVASPGIVGVELWDSADPAVRRWFGPLQDDKVINAGDTVTFNTGSVQVGITLT